MCYRLLCTVYCTLLEIERKGIMFALRIFSDLYFYLSCMYISYFYWNKCQRIAKSLHVVWFEQIRPRAVITDLSQIFSSTRNLRATQQYRKKLVAELMTWEYYYIIHNLTHGTLWILCFFSFSKGYYFQSY